MNIQYFWFVFLWQKKSKFWFSSIRRGRKKKTLGTAVQRIAYENAVHCFRSQLSLLR